MGLLGTVSLISNKAYSAPVMGEIFNLRQPDGSTVEVRIWGDEFYQVIESLDGYTLIRDPDTEFICYARLSHEGSELVSTKVCVGRNRDKLNIAPHIRISSPAVIQKVEIPMIQHADEMEIYENAILSVYSGELLPENIKGICLIVDFPDEAGTIPPSEVNDFFNQIGYTGYSNNGSVRDYFYDVSDGNLTYTNYVPSEYYTAINEKSYYENPDEPKPRELIIEALNSLEDSGFDFSEYDLDDDGFIDAVSCLYVGSPGSVGSGLWPHQGIISFSADGVSTNRYMIAYLGTNPQIGIPCHETGHLLFGWPDLYDTGYDSMGVGKFCLMGYGAQGGNPVEPCAYLKYISGWTNTILLTEPQEDLPVTVEGNLSYKYENPTLTNEYFLIENRQQTNRDSILPDAGLAVWHIEDKYGLNNNQQMTPYSHYQVTLVQADGLWDLENNVNYGDSNDLWKAPEFTVWGPYYSPNQPNSDWWSGMVSGFGILDVSPPNTVMTFTYGFDPLEITPNGEFYTAGPAGGFLTLPAKTYTINNSSDSSIEYLVSKNGLWLDLNGSLSGTLTPFGNTDILVSLNENAYELSKGYYTATVIFSNQTSGVIQNRFVVLLVTDPIVLYETDFNEGLPEGWAIIDGNEDTKTWSVGDTGNPRYQIGDYWTDAFMMADSDLAGHVDMNEQLLTNFIDCSGYKSIALKFKYGFLRISAIADVDVRLGGGSWQNVAHYVASNNGSIELELPSFVDGQSDVQIRWHYYNANYDYWWGIDDVQISCSCADVSAGDLNVDCSVSMEDLVILTSHWLDVGCDYTKGWCYGTDLDRNGTVNLYDFAVFAGYWCEGVQPIK